MAEPTAICPICGGEGFLYDKKSKTSSRCECLIEKQAKERIDRLLKLANIPPRFQGIRPESPQLSPKAFREILDDYYNNFILHLNAGEGLTILGPVGVGKSYAVCRLAARIIGGYSLPVKYVDTSSWLELILDRIRAGKNDEEGALEAEKLRMNEGLLICDDFDKAKKTDHITNTLMLLINYRYNEKLPTIIIGNKKNTDEIAVLAASGDEGVSIAGRLREVNREVIVRGKNLRIKNCEAE